jgi:hypothetical protein
VDLSVLFRKPSEVATTDMYLENSIKSMERKRRGCSEKLIVTGENTKKPPDWKTFLADEENKKSRIAILHPLTLASYHLEEVDLSVLFRKPSEVAILYGTGVPSNQS